MEYLIPLTSTLAFAAIIWHTSEAGRVEPLGGFQCLCLCLLASDLAFTIVSHLNAIWMYSVLMSMPSCSHTLSTRSVLAPSETLDSSVVSVAELPTSSCSVQLTLQLQFIAAFIGHPTPGHQKLFLNVFWLLVRVDIDVDEESVCSSILQLASERRLHCLCPS